MSIKKQKIKNKTDISNEADFLCKLIDNYSEYMRKIEMGKYFYLNGFKFQLIRHDRNIIYRIFRNYNWYLKMPRNGDLDVIKREYSGYEYIKEAVKAHKSYYHPDEIRASFQKSYILYAEIPGDLLNMALYIRCLIPYPKEIIHLQNIFQSLGENLAFLHIKKPVMNFQKTNRDMVNDFIKNYNLKKNLGRIFTVLNNWHNKINFPNQEQNFVHGNLRPDNIIINNNRICFIDLENCGTGSPYEDLSLICSGIILTKTLPLFPWKRSYQILSSFLKGYKNICTYDKNCLIDSISYRISIYYMNNFNKSSKIAGFPVLKSRLENMLLDFIQNNGCNSICDLNI